MCLQAKAVPNIPNKVSARRLSEASGLRVTKAGEELWFSETPGCSCSLLTDHADFSASTWNFRADLLDNLATAFAVLGKEASGFTFEALWAGDEIESEGKTSLRDFLKDVRSNNVRNGHRYIVGRA